MERIAVIGENGKGKSTLLKTLVGELPKLGGQFSFGTGVEWGYFDQQAAVAESQNPKMTIMEDFWEEYPTLKEVEVRSALGSFLFPGMMYTKNWDSYPVERRCVLLYVKCLSADRIF